MKTVGIVLLMAILAVGLSPARGADKKADTGSDLKALDAKLTDAFKARDLPTLGKHLDDDYLLIDPRGGIHNKKQHLKYLTDGTAKFKDLNETDVKVRVFGDTAVVTGLLQVKGKVEDKDISAAYRWTRVYNKSGGEWLCVLEQHTYVLPKDEAK
jgi:ketosteroid isomerase-like protein